MTTKTIPELPAIPAITDISMLALDDTAQTFRATAAAFALYIREAILPAGTSFAYNGSVLPSGYLWEDGSAVSRSTYSRLFAAIGTKFGAGDGSTTFNVPDSRGRVKAGRDDMGGSAAGRLTTGVSGVNGGLLGAAGGSEVSAGSISGTQSIAHTHNVAHTHTFAHYHQTGWQSASSSQPLAMPTSGSASNTTFGSGSPGIGNIVNVSNINASLGGSTLIAVMPDISVQRSFYTAGALGAASGSGASATTSAASITNSGAMSANSVVNFALAAWTATGSKNVQPTIVCNYIIKT